MSADARLAAAVDDPGPVAPVALAAVRRDGVALVASGQVAMRDGRMLATGRVGAEVDLPTAQVCARQCTRNVLEAVRAELGSLDDVAQLTKLTVYVASAPGFTDQHLVAHGASAVALEVLGPQVGTHARVAIGVAALPLDSPVEVEAVLRVKS
jgi:enamine deaminase RidA (YjgF/YER057c/UK114 family)